ncbi:MAG: solute carrier family 23 protein, partial [Streptococcus mitis]|nr:solute carrier family 23 protein [Streptococcus mitis]
MQTQEKHSQAAVLGLQHLLAMYSGSILVPIMIATALGYSTEQLTYLISTDIFMCGVATFLEANRVTGTGLPIVLGCTFTAVAPMILIGQTKGLDVLYGSLFVSGILVVLIAPVFSYVVKFFPPVVTGSVVTIIGINLMPVAMNYVAGGQGAKDYGDMKNIILGFSTLLIILL